MKKTALKEENAFKSMEDWALTEGLAEYYMQKIPGMSRSFQSCQEQAELYRKLEISCGTDAVKLYREATRNAAERISS